MSFGQRLIAGLKAMTAMKFPRASSWMLGWSTVTERDYQRAVGDGLDHNVLVAPLLWIARTFPEAPLAIRTEGKDGKRTVLRQHEMCKLVSRPNKSYTGDALFLATLMSFLTDGNAYWVKIRGTGKKPAELWYLPHWMVEPKGDDDNFITHYDYRAGGATIKLEPENIIHFRYGLNPRNPLKGFAPMGSIVTEIFNDGEASNLVAALLKNKGVPGLVISPEKDVTIEAKDEEELKRYVLEKTTGSRRGEPLVLSAAVKVSQYGFSPAELDLSATRNTSEERICSILGLPSAIVGFGSGNETTKVGATYREMAKIAWTGCLLPVQRMLAAEITRSLLPDFDKSSNIEAYFDPSEVEALQGNRLEMVQAAAAEVGAGLATRGEARATLGRDVTDADDVFYVPFSAIITPRDEVALPDASIRTQPAGETPAPGLAAAGKSFKAVRLTAQQMKIARAMARVRAKAMPVLRRNMKGFFERFGAIAEHAYLHTGRKSGEDEIRVDAMFDAMDLSSRQDELKNLISSHYLSVHKQNVDVLSGLGISVDIPDAVQIEVLNVGGQRARDIDLSKAARERAFQILSDGREEGLGPEEIGRQLREAVPAGQWGSISYRAEIIARTETQYAQTTSALRAYSAMDGVELVQMLDGRLGPTDEDCEAVANMPPVTFAEAQDLLDEEHPNGTRDLVPVFQEE